MAESSVEPVSQIPVEKPKRSFPEGRISRILGKYRSSIADLRSTVEELGGDPDKRGVDFYLRKVRNNVRNEVIAEDSQAESAKLKSDLEVIKSEAGVDALTGLPNYRGFQNHLSEVMHRTKGSGKKNTVILIDANELKRINDGPGGHDAGNKYLQEIARVISGQKRGTDTLARLSDISKEELDARQNSPEPFATRWGGDEFGVVLEDTDYEGAQVWFGRMLPEFAKSGISLGAGAAEIHTEHLKTDDDISQEAEFVQRLADWALYTAKDKSKQLNQETGMKHCVLFTPNDILSHDFTRPMKAA